MNPVTLALLLGGTAANVIGGAMTRNDALANAQRIAEAKNAQLAANIGRLNQFGAQNEATFNANMAGYDPSVQSGLLAGSQRTRGVQNTAEIPNPNVGSIPLPADTPPAVRQQMMNRLSDAFNFATQHAKALGNLGGYSDQWVNNMLGNQATARNIDVSNLLAGDIKSIIPAEQQLAEMKVYKPPSLWGPTIQGASQLALGAGGLAAGNAWNSSSTPSTPVWTSAYNTTGFPG